jgi:hypothetical protein
MLAERKCPPLSRYDLCNDEELNLVVYLSLRREVWRTGPLMQQYNQRFERRLDWYRLDLLVHIEMKSIDRHLPDSLGDRRTPMAELTQSLQKRTTSYRNRCRSTNLTKTESRSNSRVWREMKLITRILLHWGRNQVLTSYSHSRIGQNNVNYRRRI